MNEDRRILQIKIAPGAVAAMPSARAKTKLAQEELG